MFACYKAALGVGIATLVLMSVSGCGGSGSSLPVVAGSPTLHQVTPTDNWTFSSSGSQKTAGGTTQTVSSARTFTVNSVVDNGTSRTIKITQASTDTVNGTPSTSTSVVTYTQDKATGNLVAESSTANGITTTFTRNPTTFGIPGTFVAGYTQTGTVIANNGKSNVTINETFTIVGKLDHLVTVAGAQWEAWNTTLDWSSNATTGLVKRKASYVYVPSIGQYIQAHEDDTNADGSTRSLDINLGDTSVPH